PAAPPPLGSTGPCRRRQLQPLPPADHARTTLGPRPPTRQPVPVRRPPTPTLQPQHQQRTRRRRPAAAATHQVVTVSRSQPSGPRARARYPAGVGRALCTAPGRTPPPPRHHGGPPDPGPPCHDPTRVARSRTGTPPPKSAG